MPHSRRFALIVSSLLVAERAGAAEKLDRWIDPGASVAGDENAASTTLNPAGLGTLPGLELRWTGRLGDTGSGIKGGHDIALAYGGLPWGLGTGLDVSWVMPERSADNYAWLTWGIGKKFGDRVLIGGSLQWAYAANASTDRLFDASLGATYRPNRYLSLAGVVHYIGDAGGASWARSGLPTRGRAWQTGVLFRPLGTRFLEIGAELKTDDDFTNTRPRATLGLRIPHVGRLRGDFETSGWEDSSMHMWRATAGIDVNIGEQSAGGGVQIAGDAVNGIAPYATVSVRDFAKKGFTEGSRAVAIRLETTPGTRNHVALLRKLWRLADDREVRVVSLELRAPVASSFAHAEEVADAIRLLRASGKKVMCSLEDNGGIDLFVCASADSVVMNPSGGLRFSGLRTQHIYIARMLEKLGVKAEFMRIGAHKSAPEQFTNTAPSDTSKKDTEEYLAEVESTFTASLMAGRKLSAEQVRASVAKGPFVAAEAKQAGFVDSFAFDDELEKRAAELVGQRHISYTRYSADNNEPETFGPRDAVGLVYVDGDMVDGRSRVLPGLGTKLVGSYTVAESLKSMRGDPRVKSVVLRIESPGGSTMSADVMWREVKRLAQKKPVIVSMGSMAASGGYYIASAGSRIYAAPLTTTGSIGIFYGKFDMSGLFSKLGIDFDTTKTTPRADAESMTRGFTEDERVELNRKVAQFYDTFLTRVADGRKMSKEAVDAVAQGRVWTGQQAKERGLVDELGGLRQALAEARRRGGLPKDAPMIESPTSELSWLAKLTGLPLGSANSPLSLLPAAMRAHLGVAAAMTQTEHNTPYARVEWVDDSSIETDE